MLYLRDTGRDKRGGRKKTEEGNGRGRGHWERGTECEERMEGTGGGRGREGGKAKRTGKISPPFSPPWSFLKVGAYASENGRRLSVEHACSTAAAEVAGVDHVVCESMELRLMD